jgi:curved DNA-binding protein CbpA
MVRPEPNDRYYRRLEVGPNASEAEIAQAYHRLALGAHPDTHPDDPEATEHFREITEAYEVLTDPAQRVRHASGRDVGAARPITVVVRPAADRSSPAPANPTDPPVVLGGAPLAAAPPLRAGPVRIERGNQVHAPLRAEAGDANEGGLLRLFSDLLDSFWRF